MLRGAALIAKQRAERRRRRRRVWLCVVLGVLLAHALLIGASFRWPMGVVWVSGGSGNPVGCGLQISRSKLQFKRAEVQNSARVPSGVRWFVGTPVTTLLPPAAMGRARGHVNVPAWVLLVPWVILFLAVREEQARADARAMRGCCPSCGYDLRNLEPGAGSSDITCPECGVVKKFRKKPAREAPA